MPTNPFSSGPKGYKSKNAPAYEYGAAQGIANRAGGSLWKDDEGKTRISFRDSFKPLYGKKGVETATKGFDLKPIDQAISGLRKTPKLKETYRGRTFTQPTIDFAGLPKEFGASAYEAQAGNLRRENAGNLEQLRESVGVRRPGLLLKAGEDAQRSLTERLAGLDSEINRYVMDKGVDLGVQEQIENANRDFATQQANAEEGYKAYGSRADREQRQADTVLQYLQSLLGAGQTKTATQSGLLENERAYRDLPLQYLMSLFGNAAGLNNQSAQIGAQNRASTLGFLGSLI
jgi:hypothetical protein